MKLYIPQCRVCPLSPGGKCDFRDSVRESLRPVEPRKLTARVNCQTYSKMFPVGTRVEVEVKSLDEVTLDEPSTESGLVWRSLGWKLGTIDCFARNLYWGIQLDEPVEVVRWSSGGEYETKTMTVDRITVKGKRIRVAESAEPKPKPEPETEPDPVVPDEPLDDVPF